MKIDEVKQDDGGLEGFGRVYVHWRPVDSEVTLDGSFTLEELRAIADHMECNKR